MWQKASFESKVVHGECILVFAHLAGFYRLHRRGWGLLGKRSR